MVLLELFYSPDEIENLRQRLDKIGYEYEFTDDGEITVSSEGKDDAYAKACHIKRELGELVDCNISF